MIPEQIKIGHQTMAVRLSELLPQDGDMGATYHETGHIHISRMLNDDQQEVTLVHEILHTCCRFAGIGATEKLTEEQFCTRIDNVLHMVLKENPNLFSPQK